MQQSLLWLKKAALLGEGGGGAAAETTTTTTTGSTAGTATRASSAGRIDIAWDSSTGSFAKTATITLTKGGSGSIAVAGGKPAAPPSRRETAVEEEVIYDYNYGEYYYTPYDEYYTRVIPPERRVIDGRTGRGGGRSREDGGIVRGLPRQRGQQRRRQASRAQSQHHQRADGIQAG